MSSSYHTSQVDDRNVYLGRLDGYLSLALLVILPVYEVVVTLDQEVSAVWLRNKKYSLSSLLLVSTRWCMIMSSVASLLLASKIQSCEALVVVNQCFALIGTVQVAVFSALRTSAIWGRSRTLLVMILILSLTPVVTNAFAMVFYAYSFDRGLCRAALKLSYRSVRTLELISRVPVITADVMVLVLTWIKTYTQVAAARRIGATVSISTCLLRDGTLYFIILVALNLFQIIANHTPGSTGATHLVTSIPPILINRFMLNLRHLDDGGNTTTAALSLSISTLHFSGSVYGNFGEPLEHGTPRHEDEGGLDEPNEIDHV